MVGPTSARGGTRRPRRSLQPARPISATTRPLSATPAITHTLKTGSATHTFTSVWSPGYRRRRPRRSLLRDAIEQTIDRRANHCHRSAALSRADRLRRGGPSGGAVMWFREELSRLQQIRQPRRPRGRAGRRGDPGCGKGGMAGRGSPLRQSGGAAHRPRPRHSPCRPATTTSRRMLSAREALGDSAQTVTSAGRALTLEQALAEAEAVSKPVMAEP